MNSVNVFKGSIISAALIAAVFAFSATAFAATPNWDVTGNYVVDQELSGSHNPVDVTLTQDGSGNLTGNGTSGAYTWVIDSGTVSGDTVNFTAHYTATADAVIPLTVMNVNSTVAPDGSMSGTWDDNYAGGSRSGAWTTTSGNATAIPPAPPSTDIYVDASTGSDSNDGSSGTPVLTIQHGVDIAPVGGTVHVAAGPYTENVTISKALTLLGANSGIVGTSSSRVSETVVDGNAVSSAFEVRATDVTIDGFTLQGGGSGAGPGSNSGVWMGSPDPQNVTIENNIITNNIFGVWADCGGNCLIENNLFDSNNASSGTGNAGIGADSTVGLTIQNNEFIGHSAGNPINLQAAGPDAHTNVIVSNNSFHGNTDNSVIYVLGVTGGTFSGNTIIPAADVTGISFSGYDKNITVTNNSITGSARGVRVEDAGWYSPTAATNENITIHSSALSGNTEYGVGVLGGYAGTLDATNNFWGDASGPEATTTPVHNAGTGSPAFGDVSFSPWFSDAAMTTLVSGGTVSTTTPSDTTYTGTSTQNGSVTVTLEIASSTTITGDASWDGIVSPPTATTSSLSISGFDIAITSSVSVGSDDSDLTLDKAAKLTFEGQAGKHIGWYNHAGTFTEITTTCADNTQVTNDGLAAGGSCKIDDGSDLVVWTKHLSVFVTYTQTAVSSGGSSGSSGGGGSNGPIVSGGSGGGAGGTVATALPFNGGAAPTGSTGSTGGTTSTGSNGQVLGATKYNFTTNLTIGSTGADVIALQQILIAQGYKIPLLTSGQAAYGYFGAQTRAAVAAYQSAHGITPTAGYFGPITRAYLNANQTTTQTNTLQTLQAQLNAVLAQIAALQASSTGR